MKPGSNEPVDDLFDTKRFAKVVKEQNKKIKNRERRLKVQQKISNLWKNGYKQIILIMVTLNLGTTIQSRINLNEQFSRVNENVGTVRVNIANLEAETARLEAEMAHLNTEMVKLQRQVEKDTGSEGRFRRIQEAALGILVTAGSLKLGHVIFKYWIHQYYTLSKENQILTETNVALQKELQNYGETYKVSPNTINMEAFETVLTENPGNILPDHSFKIGLVTFVAEAEQVDFFDPSSEMTFPVEAPDLTFRQKLQIVLRNFKEQVKQKNYAWGEKLRQFQTVKIGGRTIPVSFGLDLKLVDGSGSSALSEPIKHRPDTTKTKSNQEEPLVEPKEKKRYAIKLQLFAGSVTYPRNLDEFESAEQAKVSSLRKNLSKLKNPSKQFFDYGLTSDIFGEQFLEIDENGNERPITDQEMDKIIKDNKREKQIEKQDDSDDSDDKSKNHSDKSFISLSTKNSQEYYESMKSKSSPSLMRIRVGDGDYIVISSGPDRRVDYISKEKLG